MREPVLFMANLLRGLNATLAGASSAPYNDATLMGQELFYPPTVFSYFSPLYTLENGLFAPEFQIYSTQTAAERADIVNAALYGTLDKSTTVNLTPFETVPEQRERPGAITSATSSCTAPCPPAWRRRPPARHRP